MGTRCAMLIYGHPLCPVLVCGLPLCPVLICGLLLFCHAQNSPSLSFALLTTHRKEIAMPILKKGIRGGLWCRPVIPDSQAGVRVLQLLGRPKQQNELRTSQQQSVTVVK